MKSFMFPVHLESTGADRAPVKGPVNYLLCVRAEVTGARPQVLPSHCSEDTPPPPGCTAGLRSLFLDSQPSYKDKTKKYIY